LIQRVVRGVLSDPEIRYGLKVKAIELQETPNFGEKCTFFLQSPVLVKRTLANNEVKFYLPGDPESNQLLTETLKHKLAKAQMDNLDVRVAFDTTYPNIKTKLINYKGTNNKACYCPVTIEGEPQALSFAWEVGIGNSTGIGFGSLK
jgi:CRISPR-associated endoribonuclease Cas6